MKAAVLIAGHTAPGSLLQIEEVAPSGTAGGLRSSARAGVRGLPY